MNRVTLIGKMVTMFFENHNDGFKSLVKFFMEVERSSGTKDRIPVIVDSSWIEGGMLDLDKMYYVKVTGRFCSFAKFSDDGEKEYIEKYIFAQTIDVSDKPFEETAKHNNTVQIDGRIYWKDSVRLTPMKRTILDLTLETTRTNGKVDRIPCVVWGKNAYKIAELPIGTQLQVIGRLQSRDFRKAFDEGFEIINTAYEVSVGKVESRNYEIDLCI